MIRFFLLIIFVLLAQYSSGQDTAPLDTTAERRNRLFALPVVFYTPETQLGFGAAGIYAFNFRGDNPEARSSSVQTVLAYTLNNQLLVNFPFTLFLDNGNYYTYGEVGYYRYIYQFYGVGNEIDPDGEETYRVNFPRIRFTALKRVLPKWYFGLRYWFDDYQIVETTEGGLLATEDITGSRGGIISGPGVATLFDTRDNVFYATDGWYIETLLQRNADWTGSDFNYTSITADVRTYFLTHWNHVVALNAYGVLQSGNVPFNELALLGGSRRMRGYFEGQYREQNLLTMQVAYRAPLFWRIGAVAFVSYGGVGPQTTDALQNLRYAVGGGLRFLIDQKRKINLRLDAGFGKNTSGYYLTIGEAF